MQSTEPEIWLPVVGWESNYSVSSHGRVKRTAAGKGAQAGRILRGSPNTFGHVQVQLYLEGVSTVLQIHRLVLQAFLGPCPEGMEGCHNDGDPSNNRLDNLRWDTRSENMLDKRIHGTHNMGRRTHCPRGHALSGANLKPSRLARGVRDCLACSRAYNFARNNGVPFSLELADEKYRAIVGD